MLQSRSLWIAVLYVVASTCLNCFASAANESKLVEIFSPLEDKTIDLGLYPLGVALSEDKSLAIVWGNRSREGQRFGQENESTHVSVIDLKRREVILTHRLERAIRFAWIQGDYVVLAASEGTLLFRYDLKTMKNRQRLFLDDEISFFVRFGEGKTILFLDEQFGAQAFELDLESFKTKKLSEASPSPDYDRIVNYGGPILARFFEPFYRDSDSGERLGLRQRFVVPMFPVEGKDGTHYDPFLRVQPSYGRPIAATSKWGRIDYIQSLLDIRGNSIRDFQKGALILDQSPIAIEAIYDFNSYDDDTNLEIVFYELVEGRELEKRSIKIGREVSSSNNRFWFRFEINDAFCILLNTHLVFVDLPKEASELTAPLHIKPPTMKLASVGEQIKLEFKAAGGSDERRFSLVAEAQRGISIDDVTGIVTVNTRMLWNDAIEGFESAEESDRRFRVEYFGVQDPTLFEYITGEKQKPNTALHVLPIHVQVLDLDGQKDVVTYYQPITRPTDTLEKFSLEEGESLGMTEMTPLDPSGNELKTIDTSAPFQFELNFSGKGSGAFLFKTDGVEYQHRFGALPSGIDLNGVPWEDFSPTHPLWELLREDFQVTNAKVTERSGPNVIGVEKTGKGFWVWYANGTNEPGAYSIKIELPPKK